MSKDVNNEKCAFCGNDAIFYIGDTPICDDCLPITRVRPVMYMFFGTLMQMWDKTIKKWVNVGWEHFFGN